MGLVEGLEVVEEVEGLEVEEVEGLEEMEEEVVLEVGWWGKKIITGRRRGRRERGAGGGGGEEGPAYSVDLPAAVGPQYTPTKTRTSSNPLIERAISSKNGLNTR